MKVQENITIQASEEEIFVYMMEVKNRTAFIPMLEEVILLDEPPMQVGSKYIEVASIAGQNLKTTYEITGLENNKMIQVKTTESVFPIAVDLYLKPNFSATTVLIQLDFTLKGVYRLASPLIKGIVQQQAKDILRRLKEILE